MCEERVAWLTRGKAQIIVAFCAITLFCVGCQWQLLQQNIEVPDNQENDSDIEYRIEETFGSYEIKVDVSALYTGNQIPDMETALLVAEAVFVGTQTDSYWAKMEPISITYYTNEHAWKVVFGDPDEKDIPGPCYCIVLSEIDGAVLRSYYGE